MRKNILLLLIIQFFAFSSCNTDEKVNSNGFIRIGIVTNTSVITKAEDDVEIKNIHLVITNETEDAAENGWSKEYNFTPDAMLDKVELAPGRYKLVAIASNDKEIVDGFTPVYRGETVVEVKAGETASAKIECLLTTVKVAVVYGSDVVGTYQAEFETMIGGVTFDKEEKRAGYITPGNLSVQFRFKDKEGNWQSVDLKNITEAKAREFYQITISMKTTEGEDESTEGAANITIQVGKEKPQDIQIGIELPVITIGCTANDIEYTTATLEGAYSAPSGNEPPREKQIFYYRKKMDSSSLWSEIQPSSTNKSERKYLVSLVDLEMSTTYEYKFMEKGEVKEFTTKTPDITLNSYRGVTTAMVYGELAEVNRNTTQIPFFKYRKKLNEEWSQPISAVFVSDGKYKALLEGLESNATYEYKFMEVTAIEQQFTTLQNQSIDVQKAVVGADYAAITCNITGIQAGDAILIDLKKYSGTAWGYLGKEYDITGADIKNGQFVGMLTDLEQNGTYCIDDETKSFTTLKNANFDEWNKNNKTWFAGSASEASSKNCFWDSGNVGTTTLGDVNPSSPEETKLHTATSTTTDKARAVKLASAWVGMIGIGKFAAGNIYIGHFVKTYTGFTESKLGANIKFGQSFVSRPTGLKGWYHYTPGTVDYSTRPELPKQQTDKCSVYMILSDVQFEVDTKDKKYIDLTSSSIIAYGELPDGQSGKTEGDDYVPFEFALDFRNGNIPQYIVICASASKYGDYFTGSTSSVMYIDDFELVYDYTKPPYTN